MDERIPVSLLTGFLGSGKTTLLNHWLRQPELADAAVIVNEFGEVGIDHALIASSDDRTIELSTGCLCCTVRGDLVDTLRELHTRRNRGEVRPFRRVMIETTGLADPAPVVQALMTMPVVRRFRLGRIAATLDAVHGMDTLDRHAEAVKQVAVADAIVVTKADLAPGASEALISRTASLNPGASLHRSKPGAQPSFDDVFRGGAFDPSAKPQEVVAWLNADAHETAHNHGRDVNRHDAHIASFCIRLSEPVEWEHLAAWLDALVIAHGADLLRVKGIVNVAGHARPIVVQAVQTLFHPPTELPGWPAGPKESRIVFITRDLSESFVRDVLGTIRRRPVARAPAVALVS